ncbi:MAG: hypothetical protein LH647_03790 [Leptolyngbyaceae cyanobacterium CAN_BIN12]|nr:hypothetical protein [Leptolyngbyaceae cyanobacterium CAN_BIN12]
MMMSELSNDEMSKVTITAFIEEDLKEGLKALADVERRSMSQMIAVPIERAVNDAAKQGLISDSASKEK